MQPSGTGTVAVQIEPGEMTVDPGREAVFSVHVVNRSGVVERVTLDVLGSAAAWTRTEPQAVALMPGTDATATLVVVPPPDTPLGPVPIGVRARAEASGSVEVAEAALHVGASRVVEAELRPRTVTGRRRATVVVVLHNRGNAPATVQVVATDPDDAIAFHLSGAVQVGPGETVELPLRMRLPSPEKQGAALPYQVLVEGGDAGQALDGQVRQPARKRWPVLAAMLVLALLVAAFVLLKPQDAVAFKGTADEPVASTLAAPSTVAVAVAVTETSVPTEDDTPKPTVNPDTTGTVLAPGVAPTSAPPQSGGPGSSVVAPITEADLGKVPRPTTTASRPAPALPCPVNGSPEATAQRVVCAWELGRLGEVASLTTSGAEQQLRALVAGLGQAVSGPGTPVAGGTRFSFSGCAAGRGVGSVLVGSAGTSTAGRVAEVVRCG